MRTHVARLAVLLAAFSFIPSHAHAQLGTSTWSLELGTRLGSGTTGEFSVRRHTGGSTAFRLGLEVFYNEDDGDGTTREAGFPDRSVAEFSQQNSINASLDWMRFAPIRSNVTATFAAGPFVRFSRGVFRDEFEPGTPSFNGFESKFETATLGLEFLIGAEWHFVDRFSLGGAAGVRGSFGAGHDLRVERSGTGATYEKRETQIESDIVRIETAPARIYLSAYF
jgi:hypothetical protein